MLKRIIFIVIAIALKNNSYSQPYGLIKPIQLEMGNTTINLQDLVMDVNTVDSVQTNSTLRCNLSKDKKTLNLFSVSNKLPEISELKIWIKGQHYSCLLLKSKKENNSDIKIDKQVKDSIDLYIKNNNFEYPFLNYQKELQKCIDNYSIKYPEVYLLGRFMLMDYNIQYYKNN
jgi:hypothetical protein